jgi:hypothetical protein
MRKVRLVEGGVDLVLLPIFAFLYGRKESKVLTARHALKVLTLTP